MWKSECGLEEVADSTLAGWSWYFAARPFDQDVVAGYYYESLVHFDFYCRQKTTLTYCWEFMEGLRETFQVWANHLPEIFGDSTNIYRDECGSYQPHSVLYIVSIM